MAGSAPRMDVLQLRRSPSASIALSGAALTYRRRYDWEWQRAVASDEREACGPPSIRRAMSIRHGRRNVRPAQVPCLGDGFGQLAR
jgi:hypothetical protein